MPRDCEINLFAVIVIYNKSIYNSITYNNLQKLNIDNLKIILVDNSTSLFTNKKQRELDSFHYISMEGNKGLSKAYNVALNYIENYSNDNDLIIWLDDDTKITSEYFDSLLDSIQINQTIDIFAPIIYGQDGKIYSPNKSNFLKNKLIKSPESTIEREKFNAINSCLAVRKKVYNNYRYDENLFLDSVDQKFFDDMRMLNLTFGVIQVPINQNFSQREKVIDHKQMDKRIKIRTSDLMIYARKSMTYTFLAVVKACGWGITLGIKCRSFSILKNCFIISLIGFFKNIFFIIRQNLKKNN